MYYVWGSNRCAITNPDIYLMDCCLQTSALTFEMFDAGSAPENSLKLNRGLNWQQTIAYSKQHYRIKGMQYFQQNSNTRES